MKTEQRSVDSMLPCPFCGEPAEEGARWPKHYGCSDHLCGAYQANLSADQWNQRAPLPIVPWNGGWAIRPTNAAADAFWKYWRENGEPHVHGYYESTWGAINQALKAAKP